VSTVDLGFEAAMSYLNVEMLKLYRDRFGLEVFVETGCYLGDGIGTALAAGFIKAYSCDIAVGHFNACASRFAGDSRVHLHVGQSLSFLEDVLQEPFERALFWLDAHYPGHYGMNDLENPETKFPLLQELALIHRLRSGAPQDVILADDMRVICAPDNPRWRAGEVGPYYRIEGIRMSDLSGPFASTHEGNVDGQQEGLLVLTPRSGVG
jgi:hypothetical protein